MTWPDMWGPHISEGRRKGIPILVFRQATDSIRCWAERGCPGALFYLFTSFLLFFFCFLISFISFAFWLQFDSNQFLKFSKIQSNQLG
jgi:hypothetical protein